MRLAIVKDKNNNTVTKPTSFWHPKTEKFSRLGASLGRKLGRKSRLAGTRQKGRKQGEKQS
jgi:hypothetical protein